MVSDTNFDSRMSRFTLALFVDSGAYEADPRDGTEFQFGYQRGCEYYFGLFRKVLDAEVDREDFKGKRVKKKFKGKKRYLNKLRRVGGPVTAETQWTEPVLQKGVRAELRIRHEHGFPVHHRRLLQYPLFP